MSEDKLRPRPNHGPHETALIQTSMRSKYQTPQLVYLCDCLCQGFCALTSRLLIVFVDSPNAAPDILTTEYLPLINFHFLSSSTLQRHIEDVIRSTYKF